MSARLQKAFVLVKVDPGHERDVLDELLKIREVKEVHIVPGEWDLLAIVNVEKEVVVPGDEKVYNIVMDKIGRIRHVKDTNTMVSHFSKSK